MKSKKVYIGISVGAILVICIIVASIFYIKTKNNHVEQADFTKNITNENTKEAMEITEEKDEAKEITNEVKSEEADQGETKQEEVKKDNTKQKETKKVEEKKEIIVTDMKKTLYVKATSLNVRSGPSTSDSKIGAYKNAAEVTVTGKVKDSTWYRVSYNGKVGYVDSTYLTETKPVIEEKSYEEEAVSTTGSTVSNLIVINSRNNTLRYYINGNLTRSYSCATGKSSSATPTGKFSVYNKIVNRPYYKNNIPGGDPRNPLGKRWMGLDCYGTQGTTYGIHGTNNEGSIGTNASHGCIRMHNAEVESLYEIVPVGTTVIIQNSGKSDKQIAGDYGIVIY
jgi:lipoprotein-anchoring transpeptidase ErfK/SrfK